MLGSRGIWHDGWKAVTTHPTISGWGHFNDDAWELYHTEVDRAELHDLADEQPDKLARAGQPVVRRSGRERRLPAGRPLGVRDPHDATAATRVSARPLRLLPRRGRRARSPSRSTFATAPSRSARSWTSPNPGAEGVLFAHGARFGGHALYVKDNRLHYVNNFVGLFEQKIVATEDLPTGENLILSASFEKDGEDPPHVSTGILSLYHGDKKVGEGRIKTQPGNLRDRRRRALRRARQREPRHRRLPGGGPVPVHRGDDQPGGRRCQWRAVP